MFKVEDRGDSARRVVRLFVRASGELQQAAADAASTEISNTWGPALVAASGTKAERKLLAGDASGRANTTGFDLTAAVGPALSGGLGLERGGWAGLEYGMTPVQTTTKRRHTMRALGSGRVIGRVATLVWVGKNLKPRNPRGYVVLPTVRTQFPLFVSAWIRGLVEVLDSDPAALEVTKD